VIDSIKLLARTLAKQDSVQMTVPVDLISENFNIELNASDYFFNMLNNERLEKLTINLELSELATDSIPFALIETLKDSVIDPDGINRLDEFKNLLYTDSSALSACKNQLAVTMDEKGQEMIREYLDGGMAELEKRRYYNENINNYDVYPALFELALRLHRPDKYFTPMVAVKNTISLQWLLV
jgi:phosphoribosylformylglycinamidine (FGAM) synthase PurS component